jgi:hypothetical protein
MTGDQTALPYRTDGAGLDRLVDLLARGRELADIRFDGFIGKGFDGTLAAAVALGLVDDLSGRLTPAGTAYALADASARPELLRSALRHFEPYARVLDELAAGRLGVETEADWLARWWSTQGYGSSESNRAEGVAAFARLAEAAGVASYIPGRRGHPTRLRWTAAVPRPDRGRTVSTPQSVAIESASVAMRPGPPEPEPAPAESEQSEVVFVLSPGRVARLHVPSALSVSEKQRLLTLIDVLVRTDAPGR